MKLRRPLPPDRSYEQVLNHYLVEREIAARLKKSTAEQRQAILATMYDELFTKVPDHPRLARQQDTQLTARKNAQKLALVSSFIRETDSFLEFGAGDCLFVMHVASLVNRAFGVDVSDQRTIDGPYPHNFKLIVYDGYNLDESMENSIDLAFSDQLIEHFHPEDTVRHFELVHRILKQGGRYVFRTPHALTGPHDVSQYFCDEAEGFHLKEWTYTELDELLGDLNFSAFDCYRFAKGRCIRVPLGYVSGVEKLLGRIPRKYSRPAAEVLISSICAVAKK
jgi:SAM-dependent methyltransferase